MRYINRRNWFLPNNKPPAVLHQLQSSLDISLQQRTPRRQITSLLEITQSTQGGIFQQSFPNYRTSKKRIFNPF